ncbi:glycosyltransferase 87 family protein [Streptomyces sp. TP-A0356]|uniref:glycosyltransferase 87 family protein n=1 Tax=Streptomyces sp. TP-A0356 TaxID=1359208 RepID=UPI001F3EBDF9|nr:glycosyltransferase 87 family protein [Streptomyces sp. TP-A0356]
MSALVVGLLSPADTSQEAWGLAAALGYGCAALVAARSSAPWAPAPAVVAVVGAVVVPLVYLTVISKEQMEVGVVERAADLLFASGTPYHPTPHVVRDFNPYLPGMALFGIPHMLFGESPFTSARLWFLVGFLAAVAGAIRVLTNGRETDAGRVSTPRGVTGRTGVLWLIACPVVALPLTIGGVDPPVIGLMCLALAFTQRGDAGRAGLALGAAATLKWTAWPAIPVLVAVLAVRGGQRTAAKCAAGTVGIAVLAVLPSALADTGAFYRNVVLYPLGLGPTASSAQSPLLGHLITVLVPHGKAVTMALIVLSAAGVGLSLLIRPPRSAVSGADRLALGLTLAIVLSPATRIGYAIYPIILLTWPRFAAALSAGVLGKQSHGTGRRLTSGRDGAYQPVGFLSYRSPWPAVHPPSAATTAAPSRSPLITCQRLACVSERALACNARTTEGC